MAAWRGDGMAKAEEARREKNLHRKVELLTEALILQGQELRWALSRLGPENFSEKGLEALRKE